MKSKFISRGTQFEQGSTVQINCQLMLGSHVMEMTSPDIIIDVYTSSLSDVLTIKDPGSTGGDGVYPYGSSVTRDTVSYTVTLTPEFLGKFTPGFLTFDVKYTYKDVQLGEKSISTVLKTNYLS